MKRKYNKAIAALTLIIMTLTMLLPMSANAAPGAGAAPAPAPAPGQSNPGEGFSRSKLRVLEVYPSTMTDSDANGSNDPSKPAEKDLLATKLKNKSEFEVTSMSMNKFISLRDDINGNYDIIYFGSGKYCRNTITDTYYGNDITALRADKVLEYIDANQLCIIHSDALKEENANGNKTNPAKTIMYNKFNKFNTTAGKRANVKIVNNINNSVFNNLADEYAMNNQRPILKVTKQPESYRKPGQPISSHNLTFEYGVYDPNLTQNDSLTVELYIDRNNNSLFEAGKNEKVAVREIKNGEYDTITYSLSPELTGIYFWKLVVSDSTARDEKGNLLGAKDSFIDVFRVKGEELQINVLQIRPDNATQSLASLFSTYGKRPGEFNIKVTEATVSEFNSGVSSGTEKYLRDLNGHYDMVVLGFKDAYADPVDFSDSAIAELNEYIATQQSVMFTHDTVHFDKNNKLSINFWDDVGQTLRSGKGITAGLEGYVSNGNPRSAYYNTSIISNYKLDNYQQLSPNNTATLVTPVNSNTLTLYPYNLENSQPNERKVANTHYQWLKLNLENEQVIPLFNLYKATAGERVNDDAMSNYYTYTIGNITYSGTGHSDGYPDFEIMLFVNTAIKAHSIANKKPVIELKKPTGSTESSTTSQIDLEFVLYDDFDTTLKYWVEVDYNNDGTYEFKVPQAQGVTTPTNVSITHKINNRDTVGKFKIRITAQETSSTGAISVLEKEMECVNAPVIKPIISFENADGEITSCLIGETITINTKLTASGNLATATNISPKYDMEAKYLSNGATVVNRTNLNGGTFTFYPDHVSPTEIIKQETVTVTPNTPTLMKVAAKAKYNVNGSPVTQDGNGTLDIRDGIVNIHVIDNEGRNVKGVKISEGGLEVGDTGNSGRLELTNVVGDHHYTIESANIPAGYKLDPGAVTVTRVSDGNVTVSNSIASVALTGENNQWLVTIKLTFDLGVHAKYYKMKNNTGNWSATYLGDDGGSYYLRCVKGSTARYLARIEIDTISSLKVTGIKFELETLDKDGLVINPADPAKASLYARIIDSPVTLTGIVPAELNPASVKQLKADNGAVGIPADGTYAGKSYYLVVEIPYADLQKAKIKNVKLTFEDGSDTSYEMNGNIIFGEPATPLLR